jgi:hypothetical protein
MQPGNPTSSLLDRILSSTLSSPTSPPPVGESITGAGEGNLSRGGDLESCRSTSRISVDPRYESSGESTSSGDLALRVIDVAFDGKPPTIRREVPRSGDVELALKFLPFLGPRLARVYEYVHDFWEPGLDQLHIHLKATFPELSLSYHRRGYRHHPQHGSKDRCHVLNPQSYVTDVHNLGALRFQWSEPSRSPRSNQWVATRGYSRNTSSSLGLNQGITKAYMSFWPTEGRSIGM